MSGADRNGFRKSVRSEFSDFHVAARELPIVPVRDSQRRPQVADPEEERGFDDRIVDDRRSAVLRQRRVGIGVVSWRGTRTSRTLCRVPLRTTTSLPLKHKKHH